MRKNVILLLIVQIIFFSCSEKESNFQKEELIGVWSGLLFQTESKYDSIIIKPASQPKEAILFKNGKQTIYPLTLKEKTFEFKGDSGLRFDAVISNNEQALNAILTNDLWAQSLSFKKT